MSHIKYISLNNFRVFKDKTKLEICPITYLIGPNSSGKSSILKALLLLKNNSSNDLQVLDFTGMKHNLGSFDNSINVNNTENTEIMFGLEASVSNQDFLRGSFYKESVTTKRGVYNVLKEFITKENVDINIELSYIKNDRSGKLKKIELFLKNDPDSFLKLEIGDVDSLHHLLKLDYPKLSKNKTLKNIFVNEVLRREFTIKNPKKITIYKIDTHFSLQENSNVQFYNEPILIFGKLYEQFINQSAELKTDKEVHNFLLKQPLSRILKDFSSIVENTEYIEAVRANTKRLYTNDSQGTSFNDLILNFRSRDISVESIDFINFWLKKFEIADEIEFNNIEGVATTIYLIKDNKKIALADLGYGITQFLPILMKVALEEPIKAEKKLSVVKKLILLEEPETNLHPKLQSLISDFLLDAIEKFEVRFIVETHSEYIIRKTQLLVGNKKLRKSDTVIYYFNSSEEDSIDKLTKINIKDNGALSHQFGDGFYDEATNLKLQLLKMKNINS
jgi:predicted ATPase